MLMCWEKNLTNFLREFSADVNLFTSTPSNQFCSWIGNMDSSNKPCEHWVAVRILNTDFNLILDYLTDQIQTVQIGQNISSKEKVRFGVHKAQSWDLSSSSFI